MCCTVFDSCYCYFFPLPFSLLVLFCLSLASLDLLLIVPRSFYSLKFDVSAPCSLDLSGHDHCLEYIDDNSGPKYVLSGAGKECCYASSNKAKCPKVERMCASFRASPSLPPFLSLCILFLSHKINYTIIFTLYDFAYSAHFFLHFL